MKLLLRAQLRFLRRAPWSAFTAVLGVGIAVASIVAVHLIGATVMRSLDAVRPPHLAGLTHLLEHPDHSAARYFELRQRWRREAWPAVGALVPVIEGQLAINGRRARVIGVDWLAYPPSTATGRSEPNTNGTAATHGASAPGARAWRLLDGTAAVVDVALGLEIGDTVYVGAVPLTVVDVIDGGLGPAIHVDIAAALRLLGREPDAVDYVGLVARDPWARARAALDALMPGFAAGIPPPAAPVETTTTGFVARAMVSELPANEFARSILFNVGALGLLALVVAGFLVHQIALIWVARQRPVLERLHAQGATPTELATAFLVVFVVLGLLATIAGAVAGTGLADWLLRISTSAQVARDAAAWYRADALGPVLLGKAVVAGVGICGLGGWLAVRDYRPRDGSLPWRALAVTGSALLLGLGLAVESAGIAGGFAALLALTVLATSVVRPLLAWLRGILSAVPHRRPGTPGGAARLLARLAMREAVWRPEVVGVAIAALGLAVATSLGVATMVDSLRSGFARMLEQRLADDLYVRGAPATVEEARLWLLARPESLHVARQGEARVRAVRAASERQAQGSFAADAGPTSAALLGYTAFDAHESARYGYPAALRADEVLVNERLARLLGVSAGSTIVVAGAPYRVAAVFPGFGDVEPRVLTDVAGLPAQAGAPVFDRLSVRQARSQRPVANPGAAPVAAGNDGHAAIAALAAELAARFPELEVTERERVRTQSFAIFDRTFAVTRALTLLALVVAGVGMYTALTALRLAQAPTRRLLEAEGAARPELALVTLVRAGTTGVLAIAIALPLGVAMAWILCRIVNPRAFGWTVDLTLAPAAWVPPLVLGLVATLLAGVLPAPREQGTLDENV
jgi:putative ABC transport system permease protein